MVDWRETRALIDVEHGGCAVQARRLKRRVAKLGTRFTTKTINLIFTSLMSRIK